MLGRYYSLEQLCARPGPETVVMANFSGLANQVRCALAIAILGHTPVVRLDKRYLRKIGALEKFQVSDLFENIGTTPPRISLMPHHRGWIIPPPPDRADDAELFNALNFPGLLNAWCLPNLRDRTAPYRELFARFSPVVKAAELPPLPSNDALGFHLRMFGRNVTPRFSPKGIDKVAIKRHWERLAWHDERIRDLLDAAARLGDKGQDTVIYSDRPQHDDTQAIAAGLDALGFKVTVYASTRPTGFEALEDLVALSRHRRMILTSGSSFGHLGALMSADLEMAFSV